MSDPTPEELQAAYDSLDARCVALYLEREELRDEVGQLRAERDALRHIVTDAALETYTPDGAETVVSQMVKMRADEVTARAECDEALGKLAKVRALADAHMGTHTPDCRCNDWATISPNELRAALGDPS